jgi:hypothetical protein
MKKHPNATVAGGLGGVAALVAWLAELEHVAMPAPVAVLAAGILTTVVLAIGRDGVRGIARRLWRGDGTA